MNLNPILPLLGFQLVWLACAFGAARDLPWPGLAAAALMLALYLRGTDDRKPATIVILAAAALGFAVETAMVANQWLRYGAAWPSATFAPAWIVGLWAAFGATLKVTDAMLGERRLLAAALGFLLAPVAYFAGAQLGALSISVPQWSGYLVIAFVWACAWPALLILHAKLRPR